MAPGSALQASGSVTAGLRCVSVHGVKQQLGQVCDAGDGG